MKKWLAVAVVLLLAVAGWQAWQGNRKDAQLVRWKADADSVVRRTEALQRGLVADSIRAANAHRDERERLTQDIAGLRSRLAHRQAARPPLPVVVPEQCGPWAVRVAELTGDLANQDSALAKADTALGKASAESIALRVAVDSLNGAVDSLQGVIQRFPGVPKRGGLQPALGITYALGSESGGVIKRIAVEATVAVASVNVIGLFRLPIRAGVRVSPF